MCKVCEKHDKGFIANSLLNPRVKGLENWSTYAEVMHKCRVAALAGGVTDLSVIQ